MRRNCLFVPIFLIFFACAFAQDGWFWYSTLRFSTGSNTLSVLSMPLTVGQGDSGFWVDITNDSPSDISLRLELVSQISTNDSHNNISCDMVSGTNFWSNFSRDKSGFIVSSNSTLRKRIDFDFPACSSWIFNWCMVQLPSSSVSLWDMDVIPWKVNMMYFTVEPSTSCMPFSVKVYPGSRPSSDYINRWEIRFYDENRQLVLSGDIQTTSFGSGSFQQFVAPWTYYVLYKWQSHLTSYLSGVVVTDGGQISLDFTTGSNLYNIQNVSLTQDNWYKYQIAWDMKNTQWIYDFVVNGNDISSIVYWSWLVEWWIQMLDPKNLNGDTSVNGADIAVIGINFQSTDPFAWSSPLFVW